MILAKAGNLSELAAGYLAGGLSLVPTSAQTKRPDPELLPRDEGAKPGWKVYQERPADAATVKSWFARGCESVAAIGGRVSGGLLIIDFDVARFYDAWCEQVGSLAAGLPVQRTGREGGGYQVWLRCPEPGPDDRLAWVADESEETGRRVAIETRGEGGYAVAPGSLHPSGRRYEVVTGNFANIPSIPQAVADALLAAARKLDEAPQTRQEMERREAAAKTCNKYRTASNGQVSAIDTFNNQTTIEQVLESHSYTRAGQRWKRPGGRSPSVTVNEGRSFHHSGNDALSDGFWHRPFDLFCQLEHGGDCKAAVRAAAKMLGLATGGTNGRHVPPDDDDPGRVKTLADAICIDSHFAKDAGGRLYHYRYGVFRPDGDKHIKAMVKSLLTAWGDTKHWSTRLASEVVEFIRTDAPDVPERPGMDMVNAENGMVRVVDGVLLPHDPKYRSTVQLPVKYDSAATCPNIEAFVTSTFPADAYALAWEIPGVLMVPATWLQKAILLLGEGCNGKSVWLSLIVRFLGRQNVATIPLHRLEADKFSVSRLVAKLANVCADLPSEHLAGTSTFKALTGGDTLSAEFKFKNSFELDPFARLVFSANHPPRSADSSAAFFRRWLVIPFDRTFGPREQIPRDILDARLQAPEELSGLFNKALDGLRRVQQQRRFSEPESTQAAWRDFHATTDPLAVWLDRYTIDDSGCIVTQQALRVAYNAAVERDGRPAMTAKSFGQALSKLRPHVEKAQRTVGGKIQWCYLGIGLTANDPQDSRDSRDPPLSFYAGSKEQHSANSQGEVEGIRGNRVNLVIPVDCFHENVIETPTFDGYLNRHCRDCGAPLTCRKQEQFV